MGGKHNPESLAKSAGYAVADSSQGFYWFKVLFPEEKSQLFTSAQAAWINCVTANHLKDA
ncbi:hypothetical protein Phage2-1_00093 [Achromobacter phage 2-1]|nr:hypothetical protein Phage2-1_00093 [Achromobacter phage 2-1]